MIHHINQNTYKQFVQKRRTPNVLFVSHYLHLTGAPLILANMIPHFRGINPSVFSWHDGPLTARFEELGIPVQIGIRPNLTGIDLVVANTIVSAHAIAEAKKFGIPCIWIIHESDPKMGCVTTIKRTIDYPKLVIFPCTSTAQMYKAWTKNNVRIIPTIIPPTPKRNRAKAREQLNLTNEFVILTNGIDEERKGQIDIRTAIATIEGQKKDFGRILTKHKSDKNTVHSYGDIYNHFFDQIKHAPISILEIGVLKGASLNAMAEYFPNASITGLDIYYNPTLDNKRIKCVKADSRNKEEIDTVLAGKQFDIIIDDGRHTIGSQLATRKILWDYLKPGGFYAIEDMVDVASLEFFKSQGAKTYDLRELDERFDSMLAIFRKDAEFEDPRPIKYIQNHDLEDPWTSYAAADLYICSSRIEAYPLSLQEAKTYNLPTITTPIFGCTDIIRNGIDGLYYNPGDTDDLAGKIQLLRWDNQLRAKLSEPLPHLMPFSESIEQFEHSIHTVLGINTSPQLIRVVYHCASIGDWKLIATKQLQMLADVGLRTVLATHVGQEPEWLINTAKQLGVDLTICEYDPDVLAYERPAIRLIQRLAIQNDTPILYIHAKGVSHNAAIEPEFHVWRELLMHEMVENWYKNLQTMQKSHLDLVGVNWWVQKPHFSGNFWLARPEWLRKLPDVDAVYRDRYTCERWIGMVKNPCVQSLVCRDRKFWIQGPDQDLMYEALGKYQNVIAYSRPNPN